MLDEITHHAKKSDGICKYKSRYWCIIKLKGGYNMKKQVIIKNFKLPKNCYDCPFCYIDNEEENEEIIACLVGIAIPITQFKNKYPELKFKNCPLIEIEV